MLLKLAGGLCAAIIFHFTHPKEWDPDVSMEIASLLCDFVGTFALVVTVSCCVLSGSSTWNATTSSTVLMVMI